MDSQVYFSMFCQTYKFRVDASAKCMSIEFASFEYVLDLLFSSIMEFLDKMIFLLVISFLTSLQSEKVLSKWKNCGDQECASKYKLVVSQ